MTGYGCAKGASGPVQISVEIRSVNNRYLDCSIRIPRIYTAVEDRIKAIVQKHISRGKVDVIVSIDSSASNSVKISVNEPVAAAYVATFEYLSEKFGLDNDLTAVTLARFPDVLITEKEETDTDAFYDDLCLIIEQALSGFDSMREREGENLFTDISRRLDMIGELTLLAEERSPKTVAEYREKLLVRMNEVLENSKIDESRILTEAAIFADESRSMKTGQAKNHVQQLRDMIKKSEPVAEIIFSFRNNREANTLGSKATISRWQRSLRHVAEIEKTASRYRISNKGWHAL